MPWKARLQRGPLRRLRRNATPTGNWSLTQQARICQLLADQLASGFSLKQAVGFLQATQPQMAPSLAQIATRLAAGQSLVTCLEPYLVAHVWLQLDLTATHGALRPALQHAATVLRLLATQRRQLRQLLAYPVGLLVGMGLLFGTLQWGVLPQLQTSLAPQLPDRVTWSLRGLGLLGLLGSLVVAWLGWTGWRRATAIQRVTFLVRWPVVGTLVRAYYGYYLTETLSRLVQGGLSVQQMLRVLQDLPPQALLHQMADQLAQRLNQGQGPVDWLKAQRYLPPQLGMFLEKGSSTSVLARELTAYSQLQYRELVRLTERALAWVQPILLTVVAGLVVTAYLTLLLPLYHNLQEVYP
ncbi:type II secretion system F family protein [Levilactobacillus namurensis]|uniref:type II secretion system F family protein n=1 Tax=Levilactobacillus namurensis TaxID=380393 RepID=UPI00222F935D|nr:type II secretion system F family protein [Levilactobacillus namurensis]MCW3778952.1 type II secretion system F family protein [Levilactobacillus namurensis]